MTKPSQVYPRWSKSQVRDFLALGGWTVIGFHCTQPTDWFLSAGPYPEILQCVNEYHARHLRRPTASYPPERLILQKIAPVQHLSEAA